MSDPTALSIRGQTAAIRAGTLDPVELVEAHLRRIDAENGALNALVSIDRDGALRLAKQRREEARAGALTGRLHGVVFSARESIEVQGLSHSDGSNLGAVAACARNAAVIERALAEGAICLGKGNIAEYGKSYYTENPRYGITNHPLDPARTPGGSGGGDAAALARGFVSFAIGADAGGSIRVPANFCGLFGLCPTPGTVTQAGLSKIPHTFSRLFRSIGPLARSIDDLELLYRVMASFDPADAGSTPAPLDQHRTGGEQRFISFSEINGVAADPEIGAAIDSCTAVLEARGMRGTRSTPDQFARCYEPFIILQGQAALMLEDLLAERSGAPRDQAAEGRLVTALRRRIAAELPPLTVQTLLLMWHSIDRLRLEAAALFQQCDFIICPVSATLPPLHATSSYEVGGQKLQSQQVFQFATAVNALGLPALAVPCGRSKSGMPIGVQIVGPRFSEDLLFRIARILAAQ